MDGVTVSTDPAPVRWAELKAALAADDFDNGRTPEQYRLSYLRSHACVFACDGDTYVGTARLLSDGVCNAYLVDVWTARRYRRRGIGSDLVRRLLATVPGQHVALFTADRRDFYRGLGFRPEAHGMSLVRRPWLDATGPSAPTPNG